MTNHLRKIACNALICAIGSLWLGWWVLYIDLVLSTREQLSSQCHSHSFLVSFLLTSYYKSSSVCLFVCLFVPYLLRGPLTDLRQTWWVYVGGPRNCPWGVLFWKGQWLDGSTGHFHFPLYYICASLTPHTQLQKATLLLLHLIRLKGTFCCIDGWWVYVGGSRNCLLDG